MKELIEVKTVLEETKNANNEQAEALVFAQQQRKLATEECQKLRDHGKELESELEKVNQEFKHKKDTLQQNISIIQTIQQELATNEIQRAKQTEVITNYKHCQIQLRKDLEKCEKILAQSKSKEKLLRQQLMDSQRELQDCMSSTDSLMKQHSDLQVSLKAEASKCKELHGTVHLLTVRLSKYEELLDSSNISHRNTEKELQSRKDEHDTLLVQNNRLMRGEP